MRFRRKRSACIGLSLLLAIGSIGFPGYAREQEAPETSIEAPADEAAAQAAGKELMDGEVTQETSGMEDAGEMLEPAGQDGTEERSADEAIADTPYDTPEESADAVDEPVEEEAVNTETAPAENSALQGKMPQARKWTLRLQMKNRQRIQPLWKCQEAQVSRTRAADLLHRKPERPS